MQSLRVVVLVFILIIVAYFVACWRLEAFYLKTLDDWVERWVVLMERGDHMDDVNKAILGGQFEDDVNNVLVPTCGELVIATALVQDYIGFLRDSPRSYWRPGGSYPFRVDICAKVTANRVGKQPDINPATVHLICDESRIALFATLCKRGGLR
jgi:hypothetical protein